MDILKQIGKNISKLRKAKGFTQENLDERSGINSKYISAIECGQANLTILILERIAKALEVEPYELLLTTDDNTSIEAIRKDIIKLLNETNKEKLKTIINKLIENATKEKLIEYLQLIRIALK
jgi:transcriptional regulator with XRE-family HTH domain